MQGANNVDSPVPGCVFERHLPVSIRRGEAGAAPMKAMRSLTMLVRLNSYMTICGETLLSASAFTGSVPRPGRIAARVQWLWSAARSKVV